MSSQPAALNLIAGWAGLVIGVIVGLSLGSFFHREDWWGGYGSVRRRLYRLAHVSLFGLAILNLLFFFTVRILPHPSGLVPMASLALVVGAVTMPVCCVLMAHRRALRILFAVPVLSVLMAAVLTLREVLLP